MNKLFYCIFEQIVLKYTQETLSQGKIYNIVTFLPNILTLREISFKL